MYNILLGGAAGDGIETMSSLFEKTLKQYGYHIFTMRDFMSRVRGGHNFTQLRFGQNPIFAHRDDLDGLFAIDETTYEAHRKNLKSEGFILCDQSLNINDPRCIKLPLQDIAKKIGNPKTITTVALGSLLKLFHFSLDDAIEIIINNFSGKHQELNLDALKIGYTLVNSRYLTKSKKKSTDLLISGNTAISLGALAGGLNFYSAYPMSPSTSILLYLATQSNSKKLVVEQSEDEISAINMALGASYAGAKAMVGTSGGGFSLMVEGLGFSGIAELPIVIVDIQRPGPATGLPTRTEQSDLKFVISASQGEFPRMVIALKDHADCFYQTARAFSLAEKYQIPIILLSDQYLGDATATIPCFDTIHQSTNKNINTDPPISNDLPYQRYQLTLNGISPNKIPGKTQSLVRIDSDEHDEFGQITESATLRTQMVDKRMRKLKNLKLELIEPEFFGHPNCTTLLLGFGSTNGIIKEAVTLLNKHCDTYGCLIFSDIYPLPQQQLIHYANQCQSIINVEQNATGQLAALIRESTLISCDYSILKYDGRQLSVDELLLKLNYFKERNPS